MSARVAPVEVPGHTTLQDPGRRSVAGRSLSTAVDLAVDDARRAARSDSGVLAVGYGPFSGLRVARLVEAVVEEHPGLRFRLEEGVAQELVGRVSSHELAAAAALEMPGAARRHGVRVDALRDEPLLAALPATHRYAGADAIPIGAFAAECVLLPREPPGRAFNAWLRAVVRAAGFELERTLENLCAPWDRRMLPVADGEVVSVFVREWTQDAIAGVAAVPFDPPLTFPIDLATGQPPAEGAELLLQVAVSLRDALADLDGVTAVEIDLARPALQELGPHGIRINSVSPGQVETDLWLAYDGVAATIGRATGVDPASVREQAMAAIATGRFSTRGPATIRR